LCNTCLIQFSVAGLHDSRFLLVLAALHSQRLSVCGAPSDDHWIHDVLAIHRQGWPIMPHPDGPGRKY